MLSECGLRGSKSQAPSQVDLIHDLRPPKTECKVRLRVIAKYCGNGPSPRYFAALVVSTHWDLSSCSDIGFGGRFLSSSWWRSCSIVVVLPTPGFPQSTNVWPLVSKQCWKLGFSNTFLASLGETKRGTEGRTILEDCPFTQARISADSVVLTCELRH